MLISWIDTSWIDMLQLDLFLHDWDTKNSCSKVHWPWLESQGFWDEQLRTHGVHLKQRKRYSEETSPIISYHLNHMNPSIFLGFDESGWCVCVVFFHLYYSLIDPTFLFLCWAGAPTRCHQWSHSDLCPSAWRSPFFCSQNSCWDMGISHNGYGDSYTKGDFPKRGDPWLGCVKKPYSSQEKHLMLGPPTRN